MKIDSLYETLVIVFFFNKREFKGTDIYIYVSI